MSGKVLWSPDDDYVLMGALKKGMTMKMISLHVIGGRSIDAIAARARLLIAKMDAPKPIEVRAARRQASAEHASAMERHTADMFRPGHLARSDDHLFARVG